MKNIYLKSGWSIGKISKYIIISLIPLILGGFYKNGIKLYFNDLIALNDMFKPLIFSLIGFGIGILVNIIYEYLLRKRKDNFINTIFGSFHPVYGLFIASVISINTNILLFILVTFTLLMFSKFLKNIRFNVTALSALIIILIDAYMIDFTFLNTYEQMTTLHLGIFNYLFGMGSGGINTTYIIFLVFSLIILSKKICFKRSIPLFSTIAYASIMLIYLLFTSNLNNLLANIFGFNILFSFVYLATDSMSSSYTQKGQIIFGIIVGTLTFAFFLIYPPAAVFAAIFTASIIHKWIDRIVLKNEN